MSYGKHKSIIPLWEQTLYTILTFALGYLIGTFSTLAIRHAIEDRDHRITDTVTTKMVEEMKHHCSVKVIAEDKS